jgi:rubredoxin
MEECPKCGLQFEAKEHIVELGMKPSWFNIPDIPPRLSCPGCGLVFKSKTYRYFGFISPVTLKLGLSIYAAIFFIAIFVFLLWQDPSW